MSESSVAGYGARFAGVGFPGETPEDFEAPLSRVREVAFVASYAFKYSPRPETPAVRRGLSPVDPERAQARLERSVQEIYRLFVDRVATGRALNAHYVDEQGQGRVWTGEQAFERGLVDELGGLKKAVQWINRFHGLEEDADVMLVPFPKRRSLGEQLADLLQLRVAATLKAMLPAALPTSIERLRTFLAALPLEAPLGVPPVLVEIH